MASIPLTLAALATSAVPDLTVFGARSLGQSSDYAAAVIVSADAELLVRVPRTEAAEATQRGELLGLAALTEGPRSQLSFAVPESRGITRAGQTRAVVTTHLAGTSFDITDLHDDALLIDSIAQVIASIHSLPLSVAQQGGLPIRSANDARLAATRTIDRAEQTRLVPEIVRRRWLSVVEDASLWDFAPTMVHGTLSEEQLRVEDDRITGVLGWSGLAVDDPALDFFWLLGASPAVLDAVLERYADLHNPGVLAKLSSRIALYHELEVARWLLQGVDTHDQEIIDDAVAMLDRLVSGGHTLTSALAKARSRAPLSADEAELILSETPEVIDFLSDTAAYEALDEDRMFGVDNDFRETPADEREAVDTDAADGTDNTDGTPSEETSDALATDVLTTDVLDPQALRDATSPSPRDPDASTR
ncbi:phosphotransferase [Leucobacter salsicius]|uniref:phosphotransferase n=1 Tax=Leucobacter salsicius TaxID=664638 RepID=UPI0003637081|nr:phosphotransferase [Leucobacter salsicius]